MNGTKETREFGLLLKPYWSVSDIASYFGISLPFAEQIKNGTQRIYGCTDVDKEKKQTTVKADDVIRYMGGVNRVEEAQIYNLLRS